MMLRLRIAMLAASFVFAVTTVAVDAHVRIVPSSVAAGSVAKLTFRCPNERATSATTKLVVRLPADAALTAVTVPPLAGWHVRVTMRGAYVDTVAWSGGTLRPHAIGSFTIVAGPMPAGPRTLSFKAIQTYADGEVVRWIEERAPGEPEPPFPAPVLDVR